MKDEDMPSTVDGIRPSIILNPHAIPSRMTIGQLIESFVSGYCAQKGTHVDGTLFKEVDLESIANELEDMGMHRYGYRRLYNGITGEFIDTLIFMGPTYYQRLQKFTSEQNYSATVGPSSVLTLQPLEGQSTEGGLKIGEMEKDCMISHGSALALHEKFHDHSDGYEEYVCRCGKSAVANPDENIYECKYCKDNADIVKFNTTWTAKLFRQEMEACNVGIRLIPDEFRFTS